MKIRGSTNSADGHAHGETLRARELAGIFLSETAYPARLTIPSHTHHQEAYFNFVLQGGFTEYDGNHSYKLIKSTLVFHSPGESRSNEFHDQPTRLFNVRLDSAWLRSRIPERSAILNASTRFSAGPLINLAVKLYREFRECDAVSPLVIEGLTLEMLGEASRYPLTPMGQLPPRWLSPVKEMLHAQFNEGLMLGRIAQSAGVHPVHLNRVFRQYFHCTVGEYIRELRIEYARRRLASSRDTLTEIALAAGFSDQSHFSRTFKRGTGLTPAQYRMAFSSR
jgi:AraC family transcriptional regulator